MERTKAVKLMGAALPAILLLFPIAGSTTPPIVVTTTDDVVDAAIDCESVTIADLPGPDGVKSLREAICAAENNPGIDEIHFDIPGPGPHVIRIEPSLGQLPMIEEEIIIDGTTEPDFVAPGPPVVVLDGTNITLSANGLAIRAGGSTVRGLAIIHFTSTGIGLNTNGGNTIAGNYIGIDVDGMTAAGNGKYDMGAPHRPLRGHFIRRKRRALV